jgi:hypothetical protein
VSRLPFSGSSAAVAIALWFFVSPVLAQIKPATNDARATFENGMFLLPAPASPKDAYTIVLEPAGDKPRALMLPAGSTGVRLADTALPPTAWTWRYTLQRAEIAPLVVLEPRQPSVTFADLSRYGDAVHLAWQHAPGTKTYRVTTKTDKASDLTTPPEWGTPSNTDLAATEYVNEERKVGFYDLPMKPAARIEWTVTALDADGQPMARSAPMVLTSGVPWSAELAKSGWKLQRSDTLSKENAAKAALFGYTATKKAGENKARAYQTEFAVIWDGSSTGERLDFYPRGSLEARLTSSGKSKDSDALKFRFGGYRLLASHPAEVVANLKYETASKDDTKKGLFELAYTPLIVPFARYYPTPDPSRTNAAGNYPPNALPPIQWMTQLTVGADLGKTFSVGSSSETKKSNFRQRANLRLDTQLNAVADVLRIPSVGLYLSSTYWHLSREEDDEHTYSTTGITFQLTKEISFEAAYSVGADAPKFGFSRTGTVGFGLKF